jgi:hypothetical protein
VNVGNAAKRAPAFAPGPSPPTTEIKSRLCRRVCQRAGGWPRRVGILHGNGLGARYVAHGIAARNDLAQTGTRTLKAQLPNCERIISCETILRLSRFLARLFSQAIPSCGDAEQCFAS